MILIAGGIAAADDDLPRRLGADPRSSFLDSLFALPEKLGDAIVRSVDSDLLEVHETRDDLDHPFATYLETLLADDVILYDQKKAAWRAFKEVYLEKYEFRAIEELRGSRLSPESWSGADYVVIPTLMAGYAWERGIDKRVAGMGIHVEPVKDIVSCLKADDELRAAVGLDFDLPRVPLKLIVTAGIYDGDVELDFIGVATSYGAARAAIVRAVR